MSGNASNTTTNRFHAKLKKCYYATATPDFAAGTVTYGTPVRIPDAVSISLSPTGEPITVNADGGVVNLGRDNSGYEGDLEVIRFPESFETDVLSSVKNTDGTIDEFENDDAKYIALLFEFSADKKAVRHCMYLGYVTKRITVEGDNPDKKEPKLEKVSLKFIPHPGTGIVKKKTGDNTTDAVYNSWYSAVPQNTTPAETEE